LSGQEFALITYRQNWGEDRIYFHDNQGKLVSIPAQWTSLFPDEPWISLSRDQSYFRVPDLLELIQLINLKTAVAPATCHLNSASFRTIS